MGSLPIHPSITGNGVTPANNLVANGVKNTFNSALQNPMGMARPSSPFSTSPNANPAAPAGSPGANNTSGVTPGSAGGGGVSNTTPPASPYASGFAGGSNDPNTFTQPGYIAGLNQNYLASMANMGQAPSFTQGQFTNAFNNLQNNFSGAGVAAYDQAMGLGDTPTQNVTSLEQADPTSNLNSVPIVQQGQPYQHFMQALNFGTAANPNIQTQQGGPSNPFGYNNWNPSGTQNTSTAAAPSGYNNSFGANGVPNQNQNAPVGAYGGFQANMPVGATGQTPTLSQTNPQVGGEVTGQSGNGFSPPTGQYSWSQGSPIAGGYNQWGDQSGGNPYSYVTGQPTNGLNGETVYSGTPAGTQAQFNQFTNQNVPGAGGQSGSNPLNSPGGMQNLSQMFNAVMQMMGGA